MTSNEKGNEPRPRRTKLSQLGILFIAVIMLSGSLGYLIGGVGPTETGTVVTDGSLTEKSTYVIWSDGTTYYAKNGSTGDIDYASADLSATISTIIGALPSYGGELFFKAGYYYPTTSIEYVSNLTIRGEGMYSTIFDGTSVSDYVIKPAAHTSFIDYVGLYDFQIDGGDDGILLQDTWHPTLNNLEIRSDGTGTGMTILSGEFGSSGLQAENVFLRWWWDGLIWGADHASGWISINRFEGGGVTANYHDGMNGSKDYGFGVATGITNFEFENFQIEANGIGGTGGDGVSLGQALAVTNVRFINCWWDSNYNYDIALYSLASGITVEGGLLHWDQVKDLTNQIRIKDTSFTTSSLGTCVIGTGLAHVTVNHTLIDTPTIVITQMDSNVGVKDRQYSVGGFSSTQFTISLNLTAAQDTVFYWVAYMYCDAYYSLSYYDW